MKKLLPLYMFLGFFSANAQIEPLLEHIWELEQVVTIDSTLTVPNDIIPTLEILDFGNNYLISFGSCQFLEAQILFDNQDESFAISEISMPLANCNDNEILSYEFFLYEEFLFEDTSLTIPYQPYNYTFTTEGSIIYLDITNSVGDVATYTASTLSNDDFNSTQFSIYPNPTTNLLHIESGETEIQNVSIFNLSGKQVLQADLQDKQFIEVGHLNNGVYLLKMETENGSVVKKFVKY
jgi:hypothetical protein